MPTWVSVLVIVALLAAFNSTSFLQFFRGPSSPSFPGAETTESRTAANIGKGGSVANEGMRPGATEWRQQSAEEALEKLTEVLLYGFEEARSGRRSGKKLKKDPEGDLRRTIVRTTAEQVRNAAAIAAGNEKKGDWQGVDLEVLDLMVSGEEERWEPRRKREVKDRYDWVYSVVVKSQGVARGTKYSKTTGIPVTLSRFSLLFSSTFW